MTNRRNFFKQLGIIGLTSGLLSNTHKVEKAINRNDLFIDIKNNKIINPQVEVDNPYKNINWNKIKKIRSTTHIHITDQKGMNRAKDWGYEHLPVSNYYPSTPYYPIEKIRQNQFKVKQNFGVTHIVDGISEYIEGPFYWNEIIMDKKTGWYNSLPPNQQKELPFKEGDFIYTNVPKNIIFSPNAEHHAFINTGGNVHINAVGSLYSSGTFDARNKFKTFWGGGNYSYGVGLPWQDAFQSIVEKLLFKDGGGITINHPTWSGDDLPQSLIEEMLDFDKHVLGIEVLSSGTWDLELWNKILRTGRKCFGFFVPDWSVQTNEPENGGFNVLLVNEFTEHACLKAYQDGTFWGSHHGSENFIFKHISLNDDKLSIEISSKAKISIITDNGISIKDNSAHTLYKIPLSAHGMPTIKYVRIEADNGYEKIFSQPIRFVLNNSK